MLFEFLNKKQKVSFYQIDLQLFSKVFCRTIDENIKRLMKKLKLETEKKQFEEVSCVVCGTYNDEKICTHGQFGLPANVVICKKCGLSYLNPRWTEESLIDFYVNDYDNYYRPEMDKSLKENSLYLPIYNRLKKEGFLNTKVDTILDIGSGEGTNLQYLLDKVPTASYFAIEPSPKCQETLKGMGISILARDIGADLGEKYDSYFDLIILRHVLEHFGDPVEMLKKVSKMLKQDGVLYIAVPNSLNFGKHSLLDHCFRAVHTYYFNIHTLKNIFAKANVEVCTIYEGDAYNEMELIAIVKKGSSSEVVISPQNYKIQKTFFEEKLKQENRLTNRFKKWINTYLS